MLLVVFPSLCQQIMPLFVTQRDLYEARERPAKTYSWQGTSPQVIATDASFHAFQHHDRDPLAVPGWTFLVYLLVLPDWAVQKRRAYEFSPRAWSLDIHLHAAVHVVCE